MDPNATLNDIRDANRLYEQGDWTADQYADYVSERFAALDTWIMTGGYIPTQWRP